VTPMSRSIRAGILTCLVAWGGGAIATPGSAQEARIGIERGSMPAGMTLADVDGGSVDLSAYIGRQPVLLEFWATWCENCAALYPRMLEAHARYADRVAFFAIAVAVGQSERRIRGHLEDHPVPYHTLWDARGEAVRAFEAPATSYIVILDADGRVAYTGIGRDQDVDRAIRQVLGPEPDA
jgi:thiol-disulfide isomerase/thioredoxin